MANFITLVTGSAMLAGLCFLSWLAGLLMGAAIGRATSSAVGKHKDVDELLQRERVRAGKAAAAAAGAAPGA